MATSTRPFLWSKSMDSSNGYQWESRPWKEIGWLEEKQVRVLVGRPGTTVCDYEPSDSPVALYRELASLDGSEESILRFAGWYGQLGEEHAIASETWDEPHHKWERAIWFIRWVVQVWDLIQAGDTDGLGQFFEWRDGSVRYRAPEFTKKCDVPKTEFDRLLDEIGNRIPFFGGRWQEGGAEFIGMDHEQAVMQHAIEQASLHTSLKAGDLIRPACVWLSHCVSSEMKGKVGRVLNWNDKTKKFVSSYLPYSLRGYIWLQLCEAIESGKSCRTCKVCKRWFEVAPGTARSDRQTCSDACRTRMHRARQEQAYQLHEQGKKPSEIAKEIGSEVKTVKGWLKRRR